MNNIEQNLKTVRNQLYKIAIDCGRNPSNITLLAVSKNKPLTSIKTAITAGQLAFGENYVKEGVKKIHWFKTQFKASKLIWHFIGTLQTNKSRLVAECFDWCHSVDRPQIIKRLNNQRPTGLAPLNVLIQINISGEVNKSGITPKYMSSLTALISDCPHLCLRGLMALPALENNYNRQLITFKKIHSLYKELQSFYSGIDTLSMGTTNDMRAAIVAGSTMLRIGTAIFGPRK